MPNKLALLFMGVLGELKLWADETLEGFGFVLKSHVLIHLTPQHIWKPGCEELEDTGSRYWSEALLFASFYTANLKKASLLFICPHVVIAELCQLNTQLIARGNGSIFPAHCCSVNVFPRPTSMWPTNKPLQRKKAQRRQARVICLRSSEDNAGCDCPQALQRMPTLSQHKEGWRVAFILDKQRCQLSASAGSVTVYHSWWWVCYRHQ